MVDINLAEAKAHLTELVERASTGEVIRITKHGKPLARLVSAEPPRQPIDFAALERLRASLPPEAEDTATFIRKMRDDTLY